MTLEWKWRGSKREGQGLPPFVFSNEGGQGEDREDNEHQVSSRHSISP